jgi:hypothetical protein
MEKYYNSYYLTDSNQISLDEFNNTSFNYRVYFSSEINCLIAEGYNEKKEIYWVLYFSKEFSDKIHKFHSDNYIQTVKMSLCKQLSNGVKLSFCKDGKILKYTVEIYHEDGRIKSFQLFNESQELVEYRESIYNEFKIHILEKIFFAESWTIHTEKII